MTTTTLTFAGLTAALVVLYANLRPWWAGDRAVKKLAAFGKGAGGAALAATCPGGILGWTHSHSGALANSSGAVGGRLSTGTSSASVLSGGQLAGLGATGAIVVILGMTAVVLAWKASSPRDRLRLAGGAFVGSTFLLTAGVAGALSWLPAALNGAGASVASAFQAGL